MALKPKKEEKKMSLKEKLAAKKAEKETTKKKPEKTEKKKVGGGKGRPAGMKYVLKEKVQTDLEKRFAKYQESFEQFEEALNAFIEKGNKSQAKKAREYIGDMYKSTKDFRKAIQDAKQSGLVAEPK